MSSSLVKKGFGVGARVKLVKPIKGFGNYTIPEKFQPHIGQEGTIVGVWSKDKVIVKWDKPLKSTVPEEQTVDIDSLTLLKKSRRREVIAEALLSKVRAYPNAEIKGKKVVVWKYFPIDDDAGYHVGDAVLELHGYISGRKVMFTRDRILLSDVPKRYRAISREYLESSSYEDLIPEIFE